MFSLLSFHQRKYRKMVLRPGLLWNKENLQSFHICTSILSSHMAMFFFLTQTCNVTGRWFRFTPLNKLLQSSFGIIQRLNTGVFCVVVSYCLVGFSLVHESLVFPASFVFLCLAQSHPCVCLPFCTIPFCQVHGSRAQCQFFPFLFSQSPVICALCSLLLPLSLQFVISVVLVPTCGLSPHYPLCVCISVFPCRVSFQCTQCIHNEQICYLLLWRTEQPVNNKQTAPVTHTFGFKMSTCQMNMTYQ